MNNPLVSICCITYNHKQYIQKCIEGFLMQKTTFQFEVLIHDDASKDGTSEIIRQFELLYPNIVKPILQTENQYSKGVRNITSRYNFSRSKGKYIAMCEGDDYWTDPYKLQKQVDFLEKNNEFGLVHTDLDYYYTETGSTETGVWANAGLNTKVSNNDAYNDIIYNGNTAIYVCTACFRSELIKDNSDYNEIVNQNFRMGDVPMSLHIARFSKIGYINVRTAVKNVLSNSATMGQSFEKKMAFTRSIWDIYVYFNSIQPFNLTPEDAFQHQLIIELNECFNFKEKEEFNNRYRQLKKNYKSATIRLKKFGIKNSIFRFLSRIIIKAIKK
jgi:glycosyltransferase involved in cell wall biosynthesis